MNGTYGSYNGAREKCKRLEKTLNHKGHEVQAFPSCTFVSFVVNGLTCLAGQLVAGNFQPIQIAQRSHGD